MSHESVFAYEIGYMYLKDVALEFGRFIFKPSILTFCRVEPLLSLASK